MTTENTTPLTLSTEMFKLDEKIISSVKFDGRDNGLGFHSHMLLKIESASSDAENQEILVYPHEYNSIEEYKTLVKQRISSVETLMRDTIRYAVLLRKQCDLFAPDL